MSSVLTDVQSEHEQVEGEEDPPEDGFDEALEA